MFEHVMLMLNFINKELIQKHLIQEIVEIAFLESEYSINKPI